MIDLHSHILPGIDDGAGSVDQALEMARIAVQDGTRILACTPHINPPVYTNTGPQILQAVDQLRQALVVNDIPLELVAGADVHISANMAAHLSSGQALSLGGTKYFLFEPPHDVMPPRIVDFVKQLMDQGYMPVLTHPERLKWIEHHYDVMSELANCGLVVQLTAASLTGLFGDRIQYWSERMLDEGLVDILASDAHDHKYRKPGLSQARDMVAGRLGEEEARKMVLDRPLSILKGASLAPRGSSTVAQTESEANPKKSPGLFGRLFNR